MSKIGKRGYVPEDEREFSEKSLITLKKAAKDIGYLMEQGYPIKSASTFVGNHYLLSERQRLALVRSISVQKQIAIRRQKEIVSLEEDATLYIDGFNTIITLEVAFSGSPLFDCMDGTIRDLAGLRGTYRLIDKTELAVDAIAKVLLKYKVRKVVFYLDAPVSNSGRLAQLLREHYKDLPFALEIEVIHQVDAVLQKLDHVVTSDAIILDHAQSWFNLVREALNLGKLEYKAIQVWQ